MRFTEKSASNLKLVEKDAFQFILFKYLYKYHYVERARMLR